MEIGKLANGRLVNFLGYLEEELYLTELDSFEIDEMQDFHDLDTHMMINEY